MNTRAFTQPLLLALGLSLAAVSFAQGTDAAAGNTNTPRIDRRAANEQKRIDQGVASGQLTARETARLEKRQANIAKAEANAKADGKVTQQERAKLTRMENKQSHRIHRQKHDSQKTVPATTK